MDSAQSVHIYCDDKEDDLSFDSQRDEKETSHLLSIECSDELSTGDNLNSRTATTSTEAIRRRTSTRDVLITLLIIGTASFLLAILHSHLSNKPHHRSYSSLSNTTYLPFETGDAPIATKATTPASLASETPWHKPNRYNQHGQRESPKGRNPAEYRFETKEDIEAKLEWDKSKYFEELGGWKNYSWTAPESHSSLLNLIDALSPEEEELRIWIEKLNQGVPAKSIGLDANPEDPSFDELPWPEMPFPDSPDLPAERRGSDKKWERLRKQATSPGDAGMCGTSDWLSHYHKVHRRMLMGEIPGEFIIYHCERNTACGGLADRIMGMAGSFFLALVQRRAWLAEWQAPVPLDVLFDSPRIDWAYSAFDDGSTHIALRDPGFVSKARDLVILRYSVPRIDSLFSPASSNALVSEEDREALRSPWINFYSNRGMVLRSFDYPDWREPIDELAVTRESVYGCILNYLFKPKPPLNSYIALHTSLFALPTVFSIGIQVRTGDKSMSRKDADSNNTVAMHEDFFRCARELGETYALPNQRILYYLVTDSEHLKEDAAKVLGDQLVLTDIKPRHTDVASGYHDAADGSFGAIAEAWILSKTDMRIQTARSGFGKIASFASGLDKTSVIVTPWNLRDSSNYSDDWTPDCRKPESLKRFSELAQTWSLG